MQNEENKPKNERTIIILGIIAILILGYLVFYDYLIKSVEAPVSSNLPEKSKPNVESVKKFTSEQDFKDYLNKAGTSSYYGGTGASFLSSAIDAPMEKTAQGLGDASVNRVSETNVQVAGIDEPDIVKTDGDNIFFSREPFSDIYRPMPMYDGPMDELRVMPIQREEKTSIINALPADELSKTSEIAKMGNLLLENRILMVFSNSRITGYDVSDVKNPSEKWNLVLNDNMNIVSSRKYNGKLFLVAKKAINISNPCPIKITNIGGEDVFAPCEEIYHPTNLVPSNITYIAMTIDPQNGKIENKISFLGSSSDSIIYMSPDSLYVTYTYPGDFLKVMLAFFKENLGLLPDSVMEKIIKLDSYDISTNSKMSELNTILQNYESSLGNDERLRLSQEINNKMTEYMKNHIREMEKTGIVKIDAKKMEVAAVGNVSGKPLNQFSLDEYEGNLRVATTISGRMWMYGFGSTMNNSNDVYILDSGLNEIGSIKDLGLDEKIYSARFIEDKGYLVTFKQIDPFFVLDLSNPKNPEKKGELKIPGYSSYLHPLAKNIILGIGEENSKVKVSLFDASDASNPTEISKYSLDDYWSEIQNSHHAFLQDADKKIFFLPGSKGAYIFSYANNELSLVKAVEISQVKRAIYINNYLYIIGENKITVLDENSWEKVKELEL